jgi:CheY-like chemotaxis protein
MLLFIEDDIFFLEILIQDFLEAGYSVITASDPNEALAAVEEFGSQIQCIILDIMMRPGTAFSLIATHHGFHTGMNLYTSIRDRLPDTRVIIWTNLRDDEREHQSVRRFFSSQEKCEYYRKGELSYFDLFEHIRGNFPTTSKSKGQWFKMEDRVRQKTPAESPEPINFRERPYQKEDRSMPKVFISHSSKDKTFVDRLATDLKNAGIDVWFDKWEIGVGDSIVEKINAGLKESDYVAVVLSRNSVNSRWVQQELNAAYIASLDKQNNMVLPILIEYYVEIPPLIRDRRYADFRTDYNTGLNALLEVLCHFPKRMIRKKLAKISSLWHNI